MILIITNPLRLLIYAQRKQYMRIRTRIRIDCYRRCRGLQRAGRLTFYGIAFWLQFSRRLNIICSLEAAAFFDGFVTTLHINNIMIPSGPQNGGKDH